MPTFPATGSHLERYGAILNAVEINSSFYRPISHGHLRALGSLGAGHFRFAVKIPKAMTHERHLKAWRSAGPFPVGGERPWVQARSAAGSTASEFEVRGRYCRCLPARAAEPRRKPLVCEPRHATWFTPEIEACSTSFGLPASLPTRPRSKVLPSRAAGAACRTIACTALPGSTTAYDPEFLAGIAERIARDAAAAIETWCIFDDTAAFAATGDALTTEALCETLLTISGVHQRSPYVPRRVCISR